jgi:hypothetical protein
MSAGTVFSGVRGQDYSGVCAENPFQSAETAPE